MLRAALAVFLLLHGLVHLLGFVVAWRITAVDGFAYRSDVLHGVDAGEAVTRVLGLLWLAAANAFVVGAGLLAFDVAGWWSWTIGATLVSMVLALLWVQQAYAGLVVDAVLLAGLLWVDPIRTLAQ